MITKQRAALIVEDDDDIREVLRDLLEDAGYTVQEVADGVTALATLRASTRSLLVLLDNLLPGMDGADLLATLEDDAADDLAERERSPHSVFQHAYVLITASPQKITLEQAERLAWLGVPVVAKPFDITTFTAAVTVAADRLSPDIIAGC